MAGQTWIMGYWAEQYVLYPSEPVNVTLYVNTPVFLLLSSQFFAATSQFMDSFWLPERPLSPSVLLYTFSAH
jgi:hypothetical protein